MIGLGHPVKAMQRAALSSSTVLVLGLAAHAQEAWISKPLTR